MQIIIRAAGGEKWANRLAPKALLYISVVWELHSAQKNKKYALNSHVEKNIALKKLPEEIKMLEENAGRVLFLFQSTHLTNKGK